MSNPYETAKRSKTSILGPTLRFKGDLKADEELLIQGHVEGSIKHTSSLTVGEAGQLKADVVAESIAVEGKVKGDLRGNASVVIRPTADIDGNVYSPVVTLLEGAQFNGSIDMRGDSESQSAPQTEDTPPEPQTAKAAERSARGDARRDEKATKRKAQRADKNSASAA